MASSAVAVTAKSYSQVTGANERLRVGVIGCGGMANGHMRTLLRNRQADNVEITAVCDLYQKRLDAAAQLTGGKPHRHYHDVLSSSDVDYVLIATPEHWHARICLDAAEAGKHIYCEKPMTRTVEQAKKVVQKIRGGKVKMQVGVQGMSDDSYITAHRYVQDGTLGKVVLAQIDYSRNGRDLFVTHPPDPDLKPGVNLDWKTWLGDTHKQPFDADRFLNWRRYYEYSGGISGDLFVHRVTRMIRSLGLNFPAFGVATGGRWFFRETPGDIPDTITVLLEYPQNLTIQLVSSMASGRPIDHLIRGHKACLQFTRTGFTITPERLPGTPAGEPIEHKKTGAEDIGLHHRNLMAAIRRNEPLNCDCQTGYYGVVASEMGNLSFRKRNYVKWDTRKEKIVNA